MRHVAAVCGGAGAGSQLGEPAVHGNHAFARFPSTFVRPRRGAPSHRTGRRASVMDFFSGVRADQKDRYELISHIGRGACAPAPCNARSPPAAQLVTTADLMAGDVARRWRRVGGATSAPPV